MDVFRDFEVCVVCFVCYLNGGTAKGKCRNENRLPREQISGTRQGPHQPPIHPPHLAAPKLDRGAVVGPGGLLGALKGTKVEVLGSVDAADASLPLAVLVVLGHAAVLRSASAGSERERVEELVRGCRDNARREIDVDSEKLGSDAMTTNPILSHPDLAKPTEPRRRRETTSSELSPSISRSEAA